MIEDIDDSNRNDKNILFKPDLSKLNDDMLNQSMHSKSILNKSSMMTYGKM